MLEVKPIRNVPFTTTTSNLTLTSHVTVVVINWRLKEDTCRCLHSLAQLDRPYRIIVVDNGSGDGSADAIALRYPSVALIRLDENGGFAAACNRAISVALEDPQCEFVFLLNNDAVVNPHTLSALLDAAQAHPQAGIFGPKVYTTGRQGEIWYAGARCRRVVLAAADTGRGQIDHGQFNALREVDYVFGAAMLIRRSCFERIGLFDARFFLYLEDLDFCLRAHAQGFAALFVPGAHVWHRGGASTAGDPLTRRYHLARSTVQFLRKHVPRRQKALVLLFWLAVLLKTLASDVLRGEAWAGVSAYVAGMWHGVSHGMWQGAAGHVQPEPGRPQNGEGLGEGLSERLGEGLGLPQ